MLDNAFISKYEPILRDKFASIWYKEKYQYYFNGGYRRIFKIKEDENYFRQFVSIDKNNEVLGYICYGADFEVGLVYGFGAINFSDNKIVFGKDLAKVIDDIFCKFGFETMEWSVNIGNPVKRHYDNFCKKCNGTWMLKHRRSKKLNGDFCDEQIYEVTKEGYLNYKNNLRSKLIIK